MKPVIAILSLSLLSACGLLDLGQYKQGEVFNTRDIFDKHEKNLHLRQRP